MKEINVLYKKEIPEEMCNWLYTRCSKCGFESKDDSMSSVCEDTYTAVEKIFTQSKIIKSWDDVMTKCHTVYCFNNTEFKSGLEPDDVIIEEDKYPNTLLLIVTNDSEGNSIEEQKHLQRVLVYGRLKTIDELSKDNKVCSNVTCSECTECEHK